MNTPSDSDVALLPPLAGSALRVVDLGSPFVFGIGRDMTDEERREAEAHGRHDNPPMSVLSITSDGLAGADGKANAQLLAAAPAMLSVLQDIQQALAEDQDYGNRVCEWNFEGGTPLEMVEWAIREALGQNDQGDARRETHPNQQNG